jgi:tetratricopeptide (TPR) repeat protein
LTPASRLRASLAIAAALRDGYAERHVEIASDLALLFEEAHDFHAAAEYFLMAARRAAGLFAYTECVRLVSRGLALIERIPSPDRDALERGLHEILAPAIMATRGYGADDLGRTLDRIRDLCRKAEDIDGLEAALFGLFSFRGFRGELKKAGEECQHLWQLASRAGGKHLFLGSWARGVSFLLVGELDASCRYFEEAKSLYQPAAHGSLPHVYAVDSGVGTYAYSSWASWYSGFPERSVEEITRALELAKNVAPLSRVIANGFAAHLDQLEFRVEECEKRAREAAELAGEYDLLPFAAWATMHHGWALVQRGRIEEGLERLSHGLASYEGTGSKLMKTTHLALFADACRVAGRPERGSALLKEAFLFVEAGERFHAPELHRLDGELSLMLGAVDDADASFRRALELARAPASRSPSLELRAALSRARLLVSLGREHEARAELARDHFFRDDFPTADRKAARELLAQLS